VDLFFQLLIRFHGIAFCAYLLAYNVHTSCFCISMLFFIVFGIYDIYDCTFLFSHIFAEFDLCLTVASIFLSFSDSSVAVWYWSICNCLWYQDVLSHFALSVIVIVRLSDSLLKLLCSSFFNYTFIFVSTLLLDSVGISGLIVYVLFLL